MNWTLIIVVVVVLGIIGLVVYLRTSNRITFVEGDSILSKLAGCGRKLLRMKREKQGGC